MARKIEIDFRKAYVSDHLPTIDSSQAESESAQRTYQDVLNSIVKDITMGDLKEIKRALKSVSNLEYVQTFKYPVKDTYLFEGQYDNIGNQILMCEPSILYQIDGFSNYSEETHELYVFVDGKKMLPDNYKISKNYGGLRVYIKTAFVNNNSEVTFVGNKVYRESKRATHNVATSGTGYKFSIHLEKVGYFHRSPSNYLVFRKATGTNYFKHLTAYSITKNKTNSEYIDILVDETLSAGDNLMVLNNNSFFKEIINPVSSYELTTGSNRDIPLPIGIDKELELFCDGKLMQQGVDYDIDWALGNNTVPPKINFTPVPLKQVEIIANDCYAPSTLTVTNDVLPAHGVIPLLTSYPIALGYLDVYVNGLRVATSNLEVVADNILKITNVAGSLVTVKIRITDSEMASEWSKVYSLNKPDLARFIDHVGVVNYVSKYVSNDKTGMYNFTDSTYPSTDTIIPTDEVNKYKPETEMNQLVNNLLAGDPNRFKKVLDNFSMNYHQREFSYTEKSRYTTTVPVGLFGKDLKAGDSVVLYVVDDFGKFGEDSYNLDIFIEGRKLARRHYISLNTNEGLKLYIRSSKIFDNTKVFVVIETIYRENKTFKKDYNLYDTRHLSMDMVDDTINVGTSGDLNLSPGFRIRVSVSFGTVRSSSWATIIAKDNWSLNQGYALYFHANAVHFHKAGDVYASLKATLIPETDIVYDIEISDDGITTKLIIDGNILDSSESISISPSTSATLIGTRNANSGSFTGALDRFVGGIHYVSVENGGKLMGQWDFSKVSGSTVPDSSGKGNNGTLYGNPQIRVNDNWIFNAPISKAGERHYTVTDYVLFKKGNRGNFYKPVPSEDYLLSFRDTSTLTVTVTNPVQLNESRDFRIINKLSYFSYEYHVSDVDEVTYLKGDPFVSFDLTKRENDEWIPLPITNSNELSIYNDGIYLIEGVDYTFHWNLDNDLSPPRIFIKGVPRLGTSIEIVASQPFYPGISQNIVMGSVPVKGMVKLSLPYPISTDLLQVFANRKRISLSQMEMLADNLLRIKGLSTTDNLVVRVMLPDTARVRDIMTKYGANKTDFEKYLGAVGIDSFISKYVTDKAIINLPNTDAIESYVPVSNTAEFVDYQVFVDRWEESVLDANDTFINQKYFEQDFILDANTQIPFEGKRSIIDANDNSLTLTKYNFVE